MHETSISDISDARLLANRENAKLSSGPRSATGKEIVSGNSVLHGLSGTKFRVLSSELQSEFDDLLASLISSYSPADPAESELVTSMTQTLWLARRAARGQDRCFEAIESGDPEAAKAARLDMALYFRYQTTHERAHARYAADLRKLQSERRKGELGFASQKLKQEMHEARLTAVKARSDHQLMKNFFLNRDVLCAQQRDFEAVERERQYREQYERREAEAESKRQQRAARAKQKMTPSNVLKS